MAKKRPTRLYRSSSRKRGSISTEAAGSRSSENYWKQPSEASSLYRLMAWLSPAFPVGAFSYSSGLEWAVEAGDVKSAEALHQWLVIVLKDGAGYCDGVFFAHAYRASDAGADAALRTVLELAAALTPSRERFLETTAQGRAFLDMTMATWPCPALDQIAKICPGPLAYPIAVGAAAAAHGVPLEQSLAAYLQALVANWVSAAVRLIPLGQTDGQRVIAALEPCITAAVDRSLGAELDDAGSSTFRADIASMRHETQYTRLFRS